MSWDRRLNSAVSILNLAVSLAAIFGAGFAVYTWSETQKIEALKTFNEKRAEVYFNVSELIGRIDQQCETGQPPCTQNNNNQDPDTRDHNRNWQLFLSEIRGPLPAYGSSEVINAVNVFIKDISANIKAGFARGSTHTQDVMDCIQYSLAQSYRFVSNAKCDPVP